MTRRFALPLAVAVIAFALVADGAETPPLGMPPESPASTIPPNDPAVQANMPGCAVWTDRCVSCERTDGQVSCSNIGIACQPQALVCLRREEPQERK